MSTLSKHANRRNAGKEGGVLYIVATPIGNLADITLRALETLRSVDRIAAEDTRHTRKLLSHFDIHKPLVSYHSHNSKQKGPELLGRILGGENLALVTDAGTPGISDPGMLLIHQALEQNLPVTVIPGPTALIAALVASGMPTHPFAFLGFPPDRGSSRRRFFSSFRALPMTMILYESPRRLSRTLEDIYLVWGNRRVAVARELTKHYEEIFRGTTEEARERFSGDIKGEITLIVEGENTSSEDKVQKPDWREELVRNLGVEGTSIKEASETIARQHQLPRRMVYQEALKLKKF